MARQPLVLGTWGKIVRDTPATGLPTATARFRDYDGETRQVKRTGKTEAAAERNLLEALRDRAKLPGETMTREMRMSTLGEIWITEFSELNRAAGTVTLYARGLAHVRKGMGELRIFEAGVPAVDRFLKAIGKSSGPSTAAICRVVLQGMLGVAVRNGAIATNPVRDAAVITQPRQEVRTFAVDEVVILRAQLAAWDAGKDKAGRVRTTDIADVVDMILATGVRTGEVLAIGWEHVDLAADPCLVRIAGTVIFEKGVPTRVQPFPKTESSVRELQLPQFAVDMLMRRRVDSMSPLVFPSSTGTVRSPNNFRTQWRLFREMNGHEDWVVPRTFRKAVATLVKAEAGLVEASEQLGHAGSAVTSKHYVEQTHRGPDVRAILERFSGK